MKTLCVMDSVSRANGGIFEAERRLQQTLHAQMGLGVEVLGLHDSCTDADLPAWSPLVPRTFPVRGPQAFGFAPGLAPALLQSQADLAYCVGLWKYPSLAALRWANKSGKPMMVAPHGMLDAWALQNSRVKKRVAAWWFQDAHLQKAACLRALCPAEATAIRAYGLKNPICVIPNGIDLPERITSLERGVPPARFALGRKVLLYLGRIHPKKGLANLIAAWRQAYGSRNQEWVLAIAGWDQGKHEAELKEQATQLGILRENARDSDSISFLGPKFGDAKSELFSQCTGFILPSLSEGLPMAVLEAWAYGKPVLMTPECNLPEGFAAGAALRIDPTMESIANGLKQFGWISPEERQTMGRNGLALVKDRFAWPTLAIQMMSVYAWMLGGGPRPECVLTE